MHNLLDGLNEKQKEAVTSIDGPLLVMAGAGSGKTKALTHRIAYLILEKQVAPEHILAVTFTNKAAKEMLERIEKLLSSAQLPSRPLIGTFHSICVKILRQHLHELDMENSFVIYDSADQQILVKRILKTIGMDDKKFNPRAILAAISQAKNQLIGPEEYNKSAFEYFNQKVAQVYLEYQKELKRANALDFDDIIMQTVNLFKSHPQILEHYQTRFKYISVDEYQDTNQAQYILIRQLANKFENLCVIGDSDQSIYSWRGANMRNILDFEKDFPKAKTVLLEQNYRSTKNILAAADKIISKNTLRKDKTLWTNNPDGDLIDVYESFNEKDEASYVISQINRALSKYESPKHSDFAILYRTNAQSRVLEEVLLRNGIPYKIVGGVKFYDRKEIKDIIAYLRVILNPSDSVGLTRIINTPARKIGATTIMAIQEFASYNNLSFYAALCRANEIKIAESKQRDLLAFAKLIQNLQKLYANSKASSMIKFVVEETGYKKMLVEEGTSEAESRLENIAELISVASKYDGLEPGISITVFLEEMALISDIDQMPDSQNSVTLMTLHAAKGLEFPHVFLIGLEEGIFPHSRSLMDPQQLEEERRLMYVGITRAEQSLCVTYARSRLFFGEMQANAPSQFLQELPKEIVSSNSVIFNAGSNRSQRAPLQKNQIGTKLIPQEDLSARVAAEDLKTGDKVCHPVFGEGIVMNLTGGIVTVAFSSQKYGVKKLALSIAPLSKVIN
ncbi:DNA helicase PcrA [bacterium]|nr:DNA helicase PcrA [bacterium]